MLHQCLDIKRLIFGYLDLQSLVNLLNCNNKILYWDVMKYVKWKNIYRDVIRYDVNRFCLFGSKHYYKNEVILNLGCSLDVLKSLALCMHVQLMHFAAIHGNLDIMKWLRQEGCPWDGLTFAYAAKNGNLDNMKWLKQNGCPWNELTFKIASQNGNLDNLKWLNENLIK